MPLMGMTKLRPFSLLRGAALGCVAAVAGAMGVPCVADADADTAAGAPEDLTRMSLSELANVDVTSVSKASEPVQRAPATIYVITHEDIQRSGVTSVPEALRLAPNLEVTQTSSSAYTISARGLGGNPLAQNFSNKLLILIDGRSVYTPLFSGIYADTLDVMLEDIDRIEVISGVGATLWGANAMNGVINIITRSSYLTQGTYLDAGAGNQEQLGGARFGGRVGADTTFRAYGLGFHRGAMELADGSTARDGWNKGQGGFRSDWFTDQDTFTAQGDVYRATEQAFDAADGLVEGGNLLARYQHRAAHSEFQVQAYFDQTERFGAAGDGGFVVQTYDVELQQAVDAGPVNRIVWGGGERVYKYGITNTATLLFEPPDHALTLGNAFAQDTLRFSDQANLALGIKLEDDPFAGWTPLPDARLSIGVGEHAAVWAAASRAIRSPTPFDDEVVEKLGTVTELRANSGFRPEEVMAYELGLRAQPTSVVSLSAAAFYDVYDDLRTIEIGSQLPLYWGNLMRGEISGVDAWGNWQVLDSWRLSPGVTWVRERLAFKPGASRILGLAQAGDDPSSHASLNSSMNFPHRTTLDATLRYVGALPSPGLPHYYEMDARFGWQATATLEVSLSGANLLHERHYESPPPIGEQITRSVIAEARWKF
jgi:iron complex outermembrane receptor protein